LTFYFYNSYKQKYENSEKYKDFIQVTDEENKSHDIDFKTLQENNSDIYDWIDIPDTTISYPMLRSEEEDFYLTHNADKISSKYGAIYTQSYNADDFSDFNTIIYGHNISDGSMFGTLKNYDDEEYFEKHRTIIIYTPSQKYICKVFAVYTSDDSHILFKNDFSDMEVRRRYISDIQNSEEGNIDREIEITENDKIITLSTCTTPRTRRLLVQAVLIESEKY
jgi:sortase B